MTKTAFVTGATGFVGLNLVEELVRQRWQVIAFHRSSSDTQPLQALAGVHCVAGDVHDMRSVLAAMPAEEDSVFHVAGNTSLWNRARVEQAKVHVRGTRNVVRAALERKAGRFVHTSSIVAYGLHQGTITEDTPTRGSTSSIAYVRSKAMAEREVRRGIRLGLPAVIMNPSNIIGPYDTATWSRVFRLIQLRRLPALPPGGGSFCHVREVVKAHVAAAERGQIGANYLLGGAQASYAGLAREVARMLGLRRSGVVVHPQLLMSYAAVEEWAAPLFGREPDFTRDAIALLSENLYCTSRRAQAELGYKPETLERMLVDCRDWLVRSGRLKLKKGG